MKVIVLIIETNMTFHHYFHSIAHSPKYKGAPFFQGQSNFVHWTSKRLRNHLRLKGNTHSKYCFLIIMRDLHHMKVTLSLLSQSSNYSYWTLVLEINQLVSSHAYALSPLPQEIVSIIHIYIIIESQPIFHQLLDNSSPRDLSLILWLNFVHQVVFHDQ